MFFSLFTFPPCRLQCTGRRRLDWLLVDRRRLRVWRGHGQVSVDGLTSALPWIVSSELTSTRSRCSPQVRRFHSRDAEADLGAGAGGSLAVLHLVHTHLPEPIHTPPDHSRSVPGGLNTLLAKKKTIQLSVSNKEF